MNVLIVLWTVIGLWFGGSDRATGTTDAAMRAAASTFTSSLRPELRERAVMALEEPNRLDWHYVPRARRGVSLKEMNDAEREAAHSLLREGLSSRGYLKAMLIVAMEDVLRGIEEGHGMNASHRDPGLFFVTVFGDPAGDGAWGWRFEGHHLSLNFTSAAGETSVTPAFFGSNPGEVREGVKAGLRILSDEESLARELLGLLDESQRETAIIETTVPGDILLTPGTHANKIDMEQGLAYDSMTRAQQRIVGKLVDAWTGNFQPELAATQLGRINRAGHDSVRFLWIGSDEPGRPHYYRLCSSEFVIEYDNTQNGANHIHTVWRDPRGDFGVNLLAEHLRDEHSR